MDLDRETATAFVDGYRNTWEKWVHVSPFSGWGE